MKPRLESAPLSELDGDIWLDLAHAWRFGAKQAMLDSYMLADRRDADLMLTCQQWFFRGAGYIARYPAASGELIDCRGAPRYDVQGEWLPGVPLDYV